MKFLTYSKPVATDGKALFIKASNGPNSKFTRDIIKEKIPFKIALIINQ